jgi:hypothetical protein
MVTLGKMKQCTVKVLSGITVAAVVYVIICSLLFSEGHAVAYMVKVLCTAGRSQVRVPMSSLNFFNLPNPSSRTMALGFTQPPSEISIRRSFWK